MISSEMTTRLQVPGSLSKLPFHPDVEKGHSNDVVADPVGTIAQCRCCW